MRIERKVIALLKRRSLSASEIASEIMVSPKTVLKAIEKLEDLGLLECDSPKHDIHTVHRYLKN
jgi:predicted transcriptional regulator